MTKFHIWQATKSTTDGELSTIICVATYDSKPPQSLINSHLLADGVAPGSVDKVFYSKEEPYRKVKFI
jgi:hypothetical protein